MERPVMWEKHFALVCAHLSEAEWALRLVAVARLLLLLLRDPEWNMIFVSVGSVRVMLG